MGDLIIQVNSYKIAPAICYESLQDAHNKNAINNGAKVYFASLAKSSTGVNKAYTHFQSLAIENALSVWMSNSTGPCDDFVSAGQSAIWSSNGELVKKLNKEEEGILIFEV